MIPAPYEDKLIEAPSAEPAPEGAEAAAPAGRWGPGAVGLEYRYFGSRAGGDADGSLTEHGVGVNLRQETYNFGRFDLQAAATDQQQSPGLDEGQGSLFRFVQTDLALRSNLVMDNLLGQVRAASPALVASSYRLRLPAPVIRGLATRITTGNTTVAVTAGDLGVERGRTFFVFEETSGNIAGVSATHRINPLWDIGLQYWDVNDAQVGAGFSTHQSVAGALRYRQPVTAQSGQLRFLRNDSDTAGVWLDGELGGGLWQHRFGVFRLDPDLLWIDNTTNIANDRQGGYWNADYRKFRLRLGFGLDYYETNIDKNPGVVGQEFATSFANLSYQLNQRTNVSGSANLLSQRPGTGLPTPEQDVRGVSSTVSRRFLLGTSFWTVSLVDRSGGPDPGEASQFLWEHEWRTRATERLRTGIEYERDERSGGTLSQTSLRVHASRNFDNGHLGLNGGLSIGVGGDGVSDDGRASSLNLSFDWRFSRPWSVRLDLNLNENVVELINGTEFRVSERSAFVSVRYDLDWSRGRDIFGRPGPGQGYGRIAGRVFLDENRNGTQEPDEPGVAGVTVYLDRGFSTETDSRGRFEFWPVPAGDHALALSLDNVPLPWGLADERPRAVGLKPRTTVDLDYPLTKLQ